MHMDFLIISANCELDIIVGQRIEMSNKQVDYNCKHEVICFKIRSNYLNLTILVTTIFLEITC